MANTETAKATKPRVVTSLSDIKKILPGTESKETERITAESESEKERADRVKRQNLLSRDSPSSIATRSRNLLSSNEDDARASTASLIISVVNSMTRQPYYDDVVYEPFKGNVAYQSRICRKPVVLIRSLNNAMFAPDSGSEIMPLCLPLYAYRPSPDFVIGSFLLATTENIRITSSIPTEILNPTINLFDQHISEGVIGVGYCINGIQGEITLFVRKYRKIKPKRIDRPDMVMETIVKDVSPPYVLRKVKGDRLNPNYVAADALKETKEMLAISLWRWGIDFESTPVEPAKYVEFATVDIPSNWFTNDHLSSLRQKEQVFTPPNTYQLVANPIVLDKVDIANVSKPQIRGRFTEQSTSVWKLTAKHQKPLAQ